MYKSCSFEAVLARKSFRGHNASAARNASGAAGTVSTTYFGQGFRHRDSVHVVSSDLEGPPLVSAEQISFVFKNRKSGAEGTKRRVPGEQPRSGVARRLPTHKHWVGPAQPRAR